VADKTDLSEDEQMALLEGPWISVRAFSEAFQRAVEARRAEATTDMHTWGCGFAEGLFSKVRYEAIMLANQGQHLVEAPGLARAVHLLSMEVRKIEGSCQAQGLAVPGWVEGLRILRRSIAYERDHGRLTSQLMDSKPALMYDDEGASSPIDGHRPAPIQNADRPLFIRPPEEDGG
jgi:hypothetical protein